MEAKETTLVFSKPDEELKLEDIKEYDISLNNQEFKIKLGKLNNISKILFKIEEINSLNNYYYKSSYSLDNLKQLSKSFRVFDSINEAYDEINEIIKNKKTYIDIGSNGIILHLNISNFSSSKIEDIQIKIKKEIFDKDKTDELILKEINQIKENALKDKIFLENKINLLGDKINLLEQNLNEEKQKNNNLKKQVDELKEENNKFKIILNELVEWKKIKNKKYEIDSKIILKEEELILLVNRLKKSNLYKNKTPTLSLIYRASRDGDDPLDYYNKCNGKKNTLCVIQTKKGCKFGGYTEVIMNFNLGDVKDPNSFVFSLNKMKIYENIKKESSAVCISKSWGPIFRHDAFAVWDKKFFSYNNHRVGTKSASNYGVMDKDYEINNGEYNFSISELEIFQINY